MGVVFSSHSTWVLILAALSVTTSAAQIKAQAEAQRAVSEIRSLIARGTADSFERAISLCRELLAYARSENTPEDEAAVLAIMGIAYLTAGNAPAAIDYYQQSLQAANNVGDSRLELIALNGLGDSYLESGNRKTALDWYARALLRSTRVSNVFHEALALTGAGSAWLQLNNPHKAVEFLGRAVPLWRGLRHERGEARAEVGEARALINIGQAQNVLGDAVQAIESLGAARKLAANHKVMHFETVADASLATAYFLAGDRSTGENYLRHAREGFRNRIRWSAANVLQVQADLMARQGKTGRALSLLTESVSEARVTGLKPLEARALNDLGKLFGELGDRTEALRHFELALALFRETGDLSGQATALNNLGTYDSDLAAAERRLNDALALYRQIEDHRGEASALYNLASLYHRSGDKRKTLQLLTEALEIARTTSEHPGLGHMLTSLGSTVADLGETEKGLEHVSEARTLARQMADRTAEAGALFNMARIERGRGNLVRARAHIEEAIAITESQRAGAPSGDLRRDFLATRIAYYDLCLDILFRLHESEPSAGHAAIAFHYAERSRARWLLDLLAEARADVRHGIDPALKEKERAIMRRISTIQRQLITLLSFSSPDLTDAQRLRADLSVAEREHKQLQLEIRTRHPRYAQIHYPNPVRVSDAQRLVDGRSVILEYSSGPDGLFLFALTRDAFMAKRLGDAAFVKARVSRLRESIISSIQRSAYTLEAQALYDELIRPAEKFIAGKTELIIIPDGILYSLPFEALLKSAPEILEDPSKFPFLVREFTVRYAPSATLLALPVATDSKSKRAVVALGATTYKTQSAPEGAATRVLDQIAGLKNLPGTLDEVREVERLYPEGEATVLVGEHATEGNFKSAIASAGYQIVHLAAHGLIDNDQPWNSALVLSSTRAAGATDAQEDGLLQMREILELPLKTELAILSACSSGLGLQVQGEGVMGLAQAFLAAGAASVLVSLWNVEDHTPVQLMASFHQNLRRGLSKSEALRRAKLDQLGTSWAAFILIGQP